MSKSSEQVERGPVGGPVQAANSTDIADKVGASRAALTSRRAGTTFRQSAGAAVRAARRVSATNAVAPAAHARERSSSARRILPMPDSPSTTMAVTPDRGVRPPSIPSSVSRPSSGRRVRRPVSGLWRGDGADGWGRLTAEGTAPAMTA